MKKKPVNIFRKWFAYAGRRFLHVHGKNHPPLHNAMCLSTVSQYGKPSSRMVLLKEFDQNGFVFYTNFNSQKGKDISSNRNVSLSFYWVETGRQVRIDGIALPVAAADADDYFHSRPREYQIGAWASRQSEILKSRQVLLEKFRFYKKKYSGMEVPRPPHWSGYCVVPARIEFWENRPNRLHERRLFIRKKNKWVLKLIYP